MDKSTSIIIMVLVFTAAFLLFLFILTRSFDTGKNKEIKDRIRKATEDESSGEQSLVRKKYSHEVSIVERLLKASLDTAALDDLLDQAGKTYPAHLIVSLMFGLALLACALSWYFIGNIIVIVSASLLAGFLPIFKLKLDRKNRLAMVEEQLPDALDMMTRALKAGYPFNEAMHYIAKESQPPIAIEFGITFEEINYGLDIKDAFNNLLVRVPSTNLMAVTTAILIQHETGGNLSELLEKTCDILRKRIRFERRVKTITAECRMSAWVLALLPFIVFIAIQFNSPSYLKPLFETENGHLLLWLGLTLQVTGGLWVRKQVNFDY